MAVGEITKAFVVRFGCAFGKPLGERKTAVDVGEFERCEMIGDRKKGGVVPLKETLVDGLDVSSQEAAEEALKPTK